MKHFMYRLGLFKEIFYPRRCCVCGCRIEIGLFCRKCRNGFILQKTLHDQDDLSEIILLYKYKEQLQDALRQIKFANNRQLLFFLSEEARSALPKNIRFFVKDYDMICNIPTSVERLQKRGFDVPTEIFSCLQKEKWMPDLMERSRKTMPLFELEPLLRQEELRGCFSIRHVVAGKKILLCDDIFTTGSTMQEAARTLLNAGAVSVSALAFSASKDNW